MDVLIHFGFDACTSFIAALNWSIEYLFTASKKVRISFDCSVSL
jgi:hypothetical protein